MGRVQRTKLALALLTFLFLGRVIGQFLADVGDVAWLSPNSLWQASSLSYTALLSIQILVLLMMALAIWRLHTIRERPFLARILTILALAYGATMLGRAIIGYFGLAEASWFEAPISTPIHWVLAGWLLIFADHLGGDGHRARRRSVAPLAIRAAGYPLTMIACCALFSWLLQSGSTPKFAAYLPIILGASVIFIAELAAPYRPGWFPDRQDVVHDGLFLVIVQIALPTLITLALVEAVADGLSGRDFGLWPHDWPIIAQVLLMLLASDFLRYWLHRAFHGSRFLWRLHAVHHSPKELYFLNVGRFHPLEKCIQFAVDAAPFLLLGVGPEVVSGYFVFYAVNGFFQHSNVDVRLGVTNWIISGPELHRWHHSRKIKESDRNFGNNLIIWDALFGTRFLPEEREVGELGLKNRAYPKDFVRQTLAPITVNPNQN